MIVPPPPPVTADRPVAFFDTECYPNYWLLKIRPKGGQCITFRLFAGQSFAPDVIERIKLLFRAYKVISFFGNGYDVPMINTALCGFSAELLKQQNDRLIVQRIKPWELGLPRWEPADHIDIMEVAPGAGSQKQYAGRIHCKRMQDLPYTPDTVLTGAEMLQVDDYCENNDLVNLEALFDELQPQIRQREALGKRYGIDLRSKSDAQVAEAVLRLRCEQAVGCKLYKHDINWNLQFQFDVPPFIAYEAPQLRRLLDIVRASTFTLGPSGAVQMPEMLEGLEINLGQSTYKVGIGGLHSHEKRIVHKSDAYWVIKDIDVASYYPNLMLNSGAWPPALGEAFLKEFALIKDERLACKALVKRLRKAGDTVSIEYLDAKVGDEGGKIMINGTFGKTGSPYSILFAPKMLIQTTLTGQLSLLMLVEWHEAYGIPVISANTDGLVIKCPRHLQDVSSALVAEWERRTGLEMETVEYSAVYWRDVNSYFAIKVDGEVKRKGEYSKAGLVEKKNPDVEICSDAVADFLARGVPVAQTIRGCTDIRKFVTIQKVDGGAVKMWGEGPRKGTLVREMLSTLQASGWVKEGRKWRRGEHLLPPGEAYAMCFAPQRPEYMGKVVRWYYGTNSPGPIVYARSGNNVGMSQGAQPCMNLPDRLPDDIDYDWYLAKADAILHDIGYYDPR